MTGRRQPHIGDMAFHKGNLDPRIVADVSNDKERIKLKIGNIETQWVRADNYTYQRREERKP